MMVLNSPLNGYVAAPSPSERVSEGGKVAGKGGPIQPPDGKVAGKGGPIQPPPAAIEAEEGFALGEWRRQNSIQLERKEKEMLKVIINEADEYKAEFYKKWKIKCESSKALSREKEKGLQKFLEDGEKFNAEADKSFWKAIAELIPREVPLIEKKGKKPTIVVIQGPKPGKPSNLSRMRQVLAKLKHEPPVHMIRPPTSTTNQGVLATAKNV